MRLAIVISTLGGGGAERVATEMANHWAERHWDVAVVTWSPCASKDAYALAPEVTRIVLPSKAKWFRWPGKIGRNFYRVLAIRGAVKQWSPDAVLSFIDSTNIITLIACIGLKASIVVSERTDPAANMGLPWIWRVLRRMTYRWSDVVVAQTDDVGKWLDRQCGVTSMIIPNFVRQLPSLDAAADREKTVLAVGRLAREKNNAALIRAFAKAHGDNPEWRLEIAGDGPERSDLEKLAEQCGVGAFTTFHGFVARPEQRMARAGIYVLCSDFEGFPNSLLEAMAMGLAVVSSDCGPGPRELICDGTNGLLFRVGDVEQLAEKLHTLMNEPRLRQDLGSMAMKVRSRFERESVMRLWEVALDRARGK